MGNLLGSYRPSVTVRTLHKGLLLLGPLALMMVACGGNDGSEDADAAGLRDVTGTDATDSTDGDALRPCAEDRHLVVFDLNGSMFSNDQLVPWANDGVEPDPFPGNPEVASAYRERGYEIMYLTTLPGYTTLGTGQLFTEAIQQFLVNNGYPADEGGTHIWIWDGQPVGISWTSITDELLRFAGEGVSVDAGYTENDDKVYALATAGVTADRIFTFESLPIATPSNPLPGDDYVAHLATVEALPPVCQVG